MVQALKLIFIIFLFAHAYRAIAAEPPNQANRILISRFIDNLGTEVLNNIKDDSDFKQMEFDTVICIVYGMFELYDEAIVKLNTVNRQDPGYSLAHFVHASICALKKDAACAVSELKKSTIKDARYLYFANKSMDFDGIRGNKEFLALTGQENDSHKFSEIAGEMDSVIPVSALKNNAEKVLKEALLKMVFKKVDVIGTSREIIADLDDENNIADSNNIYDKRLRKVLVTLKPESLYNFKIYLSPLVNAFSAADGSIRMTSGMMDLMKDDELASVIAHEIGHIELKHRQKQIISSQVSRQLGRSLLEGLEKYLIKLNIKKGPDLDKVEASLEVLVTGKFSQALENNADDFSVEYLKKHGIDQDAAVRSLKKFAKFEAIEKEAAEKRAGRQPDVISYVSSHLNTKERIERLDFRDK